MADRLDVAERLAEGRPAVEHTQSYVRACHTLGYQHPDLTSHPSRIGDWYDSEDGLDLHALDRDCAELRAAGAAVAEALRMQRVQLDELAAAWMGPGGDSAVAFLQHHCDAAATVATEVRAAAQRCESLRDNLWFLLDSKVATAIAIDDRTQGQRPAWLAAATAVTTGVGDRATAEEVVRQQINPYVDNDIRDDWLTAMRSTVAGIATSYDMVTDRMAAAPAACFEVPGDFGPDCPPPRPAPPSAPVVTAAVSLPAAFPGPAADPAPTSPAAAPTTPAAAVPDLGSALGSLSSLPTGGLGALGGGPSGLGGPGGLGGLGGLASRIVDAMGGLLGSPADQFADPGFDGASSDEDPFHPDDRHPDDRHHDDKHHDDKHDGADEKSDGPDDKHGDEARPVDATPPVDGTPPADAPLAVPEPVAAPAPPTGAPAPPIGAPAPPTGGPAPPGHEKSTPCEIAADQLPQAGQ